jgi:hypothetical protein
VCIITKIRPHRPISATSHSKSVTRLQTITKETLAETRVVQIAYTNGEKCFYFLHSTAPFSTRRVADIYVSVNVELLTVHLELRPMFWATQYTRNSALVLQAATRLLPAEDFPNRLVLSKMAAEARNILYTVLMKVFAFLRPSSS